MFCLSCHELKNNHNVGCSEKGLDGTFGPGIILQKDNFPNALDDHLNSQKLVKIEENSTLFHGKRIGGGRVSTGRGRAFSFRYNIDI